MFLTLNPAAVGEVVVIMIGVALLLKKIVDMDKYHWARVVGLTLILSWVVTMFFIGAALGPIYTFDCVVELDRTAF